MSQASREHILLVETLQILNKNRDVRRALEGSMTEITLTEVPFTHYKVVIEGEMQIVCLISFFDPRYPGYAICFMYQKHSLFSGNKVTAHSVLTSTPEELAKFLDAQKIPSELLALFQIPVV